jgi:hypothetical protein
VEEALGKEVTHGHGGGSARSWARNLRCVVDLCTMPDCSRIGEDAVEKEMLGTIGFGRCNMQMRCVLEIGTVANPTHLL